MFKSKKSLIVVACGVLLLAIGALALLPSTAASALGGLLHGGPGGFDGHGFADDTYLAQALGVTAEQLQTARTAAWQAAVDEALKQGLITDAQATRLKAQAGGFHGRGEDMLSWLAGSTDAIDYNALLAKQLGISVDDLSAARNEALELRIQAGLDSGELTQAQADLMRAQHAAKAYIDHEAVLASALGISVEDLQAARDQGKTISDLMTEQGVSTDELNANLQTAYETAVQKAVDEGVITADQATLLLQHAENGGRFGVPGFHGGPGH